MRWGRVVPEDWKLLRGLLAGLGTIALVLAVVSLLSVRPYASVRPVWLYVVANIAIPSAVAALAVIAAVRVPRLRKVMAPVAIAAALVGGVDAVNGAVFARFVDGLRGETCTPEPGDCREMVTQKFGAPRSLLPTASFVGGLELTGGETSEDSSYVAFIYQRRDQPDADASLVLVVALRRPDSKPVPPVDPAAYRRTPGGRRILMTDDGTRVDFWDARYHYVLDVRPEAAPTAAGRRRAADIIVDSLR